MSDFVYHLPCPIDTAANWTANNPTYSAGIIGIESDTWKAKVFDGTSAWADLDYWSPGSSGVAWGAITGTLSDQSDLSTALAAKAPTASPSFTGTVTLPTGLSGLLKAASGVVSVATAKTDYAPATSGSGVLKGDGAGGFAAAALSDLGIARGSGSGTTDASGNLTVSHTLGTTPAFFMVVFTALAGGKTATFIPSGTKTSTTVAGTVNQGNGSAIASTACTYTWLAIA